MRHHQHRAAKFLQGHGQRQTHFEVQVVGRFVEQQQVGFFPGNQCQRQAGFFATREIQHRLVQTRATEVETTEEVAQGLLALGRRQTLQVQQWGGFGVQRIELMLGEVANGEVFTTHQPTALRLKLAGQVFDQCRLAGAVGAQQADARARRQLQFDLLQDGLVAVTQARVG